MAKKRLTVKQQKFIDAYAGNATEAARIAGYKGDNSTLRSIGAQNLTKLNIQEAIQERQQKENDALIATRQDREKLLTEFMNDEGLFPKDRMRAIELLGKMNGDFLERRDITNSDGSMKPVKEITFIPYDPEDSDDS